MNDQDATIHEIYQGPKVYNPKIDMDEINRRFGTDFKRGMLVNVHGEVFRILHNHGYNLVAK